MSDSRGTGTRAELRGGLPGSGQTGRECTVQVSKQPCGVDTWVWGEGYTLQSSVALASSRDSFRNGRVQCPARVLPECYFSLILLHQARVDQQRSDLRSEVALLTGNKAGRC